MSSRKRRHTSTTAAPPPPPEATLAARTLPSDLLLEIVARSDGVTLIRGAACCKPLRRDILSPAFIRRACHGDGAGGAAAVVPPRLFGFIPTHSTSRQAEFSLAHPATHAAADLSEKHLSPSLARAGGDLLACFYDTLTSRNGLVALEHRDRKSGICVYNPMTRDCRFIQQPPDMKVPYLPFFEAYVLLTASNGIGCSFLLLMVNFTGLLDASCSIRVQTMSLDSTGSGKWSPVTSFAGDRSRGSHRHLFCSAVVLGGSIHWLMLGGSRRDGNRLTS
ncbi:hypothetical protein U9M48_005118 [Paspalum notatum var. saurae]|uniref:F-box domain-containing protein n=1 Tax=Paspalum notatum var. saurae TaxID=547442 RepID=A0AAQ3PLN6_PASNO